MRHKHNLGFLNLTTGDMGKLYPIGCTPALPGDTVQHSTNVLVRMQHMLAPVMHQVTARVHHFFVPNRFLWNKKDWFGEADDTNGSWEDFITGGPDGNNAEVPPTITTTGTAADMLDYLGIPTVAGININAMPIRAVNAIFNIYYRDQDLVTKRLADDLTIPNIAWEKDYLTTARPWEQKGDAVTIPLGTTAPVVGIGKANQTYNTGPVNRYETGASGTTAYAKYATAGGFDVEEDPNNPGFPGIFADLSNATGATANEIRRAFAIQRYQEARARYGSRYSEYLKYLGVLPDDLRIDEPEFLAGGQVPISFSEVISTSNNSSITGDPNDKVGGLRGHGIAALRSNKYRRHITEHGYIVTMFSMRPKSVYNDAIDREFLKTTKEDYYQRELEFIGQQQVYLNEVYADAASGMDTWGYSDRYQEYRENKNRICGQFRTTVADYWHLARKFGAAPALNAAMVECNPTKRVFADQTDHSMWIMAQHRMVARRLVARSTASRIL